MDVEPVAVADPVADVAVAVLKLDAADAVMPGAANIVGIITEIST